MFLLLALLLFEASTSLEGVDHYKNTSDVIDYLLNTTRYDKRLRPYYRLKAADVEIDLSVVSIGQVREIYMDYSMDIFFRQSWTDQRLIHSLDAPILLKDEEKHRLWLPDTYFQNVKVAKFYNVPSDNSRILIYPNGEVLYGTRIAFTASCEMDLRRYPMDTQTCILDILSFSYPKKDVNYRWLKEGAEIDVINDKMSEYDLKGTQTTSYTETFTYAGEFTHLLCHFSFARRVEYSLIQFYAPTCLIVILSWLSFWISHEAVPARVGLGITTLLTIVTLMASIRSSVPKVSYVKAVDWYLIPSFMFVFGSILEYVCTLVHVRSQKSKKSARENQKAWMACPISSEAMDLSSLKVENGVQKSETNGIHYDTPPEPYSSQKNYIKKRFINAYEELTKKQGQDVNTDHNQPSKADVIDRMSRILFPLGYLLFNLVYIAVFSG